ncbi:hypothetical protein ACQ7B2_09260, partial [Escherichia coli]
FQVAWGDFKEDHDVDVEFADPNDDDGKPSDSDTSEWGVDKNIFKNEGASSVNGVYQSMIPVHEYGHYLGLMDEYKHDG